jgi:ribonuclease HII
MAPRVAGWSHERGLAQGGVRNVAGVDEVGRGCLAGPVVAAAVILDPARPIPGVRDSKTVPPGERTRLARRIAAEAVAMAIGVVDAGEIDRTDILRATLAAMRRAVAGLRVRPDHLLVDALQIPGLDLPQTAIIRGDRDSVSIAAASIVAKFFRDEMMSVFARLYPAYDFELNRGYGTPAHLEALRRHGLTPLHRVTFHGVRDDLTLFPAAGAGGG